MSTAADAPPREALEILESVAIGEGAVNADGTVTIDVIRPGIGRGKGRHLYTPEMLAENAHVFEGWRMYVDHLSDEAKRKLQGLPRSIRDLAGRITESYWDPNVPADPSKGFGQGAVRGKTRPVPWLRELIEHDPELIEASINARATSVKRSTDAGGHAWVVEGIEPRGSVDWVTEAGAGGRVVSLIEAHADDDEVELLEAMTDDAITDYLRERRPELLESKPEDPEDAADGGDDELQEKVKALMKKGMPRKMAMAAAKKQMQEAEVETEEEEEDVPLTPEALREALTTDEGQELLDELLGDRVEAKLNELLPGKLEEAMEEERELIRLEARADSDRAVFLRDARDHAHKLIAESKLLEPFQKVLRDRFDIRENRPTADLDVIEEFDGEGEVVKTAMQVLEENLQAAIDEQRQLQHAAAPQTRARKQEELQEAATDEEGKPVRVPTTGSPRTDEILRRSGFAQDNLDKVYG